MRTGETTGRDERLFFTVTDLKQYVYCPRVVYYTYCLPLVRPLTFKMERGIAAHERAGQKERRRTLAAYGLKRGERHFDVRLESAELGLRGRLDLVIETDENAAGERELIPVEYKHSRRAAGGHWKRQLAAYGLMLEEAWGLPARRGFIYFLPSRRTEQVALTPRLWEDVRATVSALRQAIEREAMPPPPKSRRPCVDCEFRRFCNDVL
jgi:CRISPR-associated exonuclease Cas4